MKRKNIFKSLLAAAMALTMIFGAAPLSGFVGISLPLFSMKAEAATTDDGLFEYEVERRWIESGYQDGVTITRYKGPNSGEVVIPKTIDGLEVKWIGDIYSGAGVFKGRAGITSIVIPDSVTSIGKSTFSGCTSLAEITVSPDNKNFSSVDGVLFNKDGSALMVYPKGNGRNTYTVPDGVAQIGGSAFSGCKNLREITIPDSVTEICNDAFSGCKNLTEITIPDSVTEIGNDAFSGCKNLREIAIPDSVTKIGSSAFYDCTRLAEIVIPDSVTEIGSSAFSGCTSLSKVDLPKKLTTIDGGIFYGCTSLAEITIPDSVTEIGSSAFYRCTSLAEIVIPDSVTEIGNNAFYCCTALSKVKLPNGLTEIGSAVFSSCEKLTEITIPGGVTEIGDNAFRDCRSLSKVKFPNGLTEIGDNAFYYCTSLSKVKLPNGLMEMGAWVFSGCSSLTEITIPDSVTEIGREAFFRCRSLVDIIVSPDNKNYSSIDGVLFSGDMSTLLAYPIGNKRSTYTVPDSVTSIIEVAFSECTNLEKIIISDGVTSIGRSAFSSCKKLREITIPDSVTEIESYAFYYCPSLSKVKLSNNLTNTGFMTFANCSSLAEIVIPDSVTSIGESTFSGCTSLAEIVIPDSVTSIGEYAFSSCTSLKKITIPDSVTIIKEFAFKNCSTIKIVCYLGTRAQWQEIIIGAENEALTNVTIHCIDDPHIWGEWEVVEEATYEKEGLERRACSLCDIEETRVIPKLVRASAIELSESEKTVFVGDTFTITATVKPEDAFNRTVTWSSSDPSIATVDENGTVTAIAKGEAIITAESADGVKAECKVTVEKKVAAIELSESEKTVFVGDTFTITATVKPEDAFNRTVTWSSSDPSIATVDENGTVTAIAKGEATITAESADGVKAECKVTVEKKDGFFKTLLKIITAPFRAIIYLFKKLLGK